MRAMRAIRLAQELKMKKDAIRKSEEKHARQEERRRQRTVLEYGEFEKRAEALLLPSQRRQAIPQATSLPDVLHRRYKGYAQQQPHQGHGSLERQLGHTPRSIVFSNPCTPRPPSFGSSHTASDYKPVKMRLPLHLANDESPQPIPEDLMYRTFHAQTWSTQSQDDPPVSLRTRHDILSKQETGRHPEEGKASGGDKAKADCERPSLAVKQKPNTNADATPRCKPQTIPPSKPNPAITSKTPSFAGDKQQRRNGACRPREKRLASGKQFQARRHRQSSSKPCLSGAVNPESTTIDHATAGPETCSALDCSMTGRLTHRGKEQGHDRHHAASSLSSNGRVSGIRTSSGASHTRAHAIPPGVLLSNIDLPPPSRKRMTSADRPHSEGATTERLNQAAPPAVVDQQMDGNRQQSPRPVFGSHQVFALAGIPPSSTGQNLPRLMALPPGDVFKAPSCAPKVVPRLDLKAVLAVDEHLLPGSSTSQRHPASTKQLLGRSSARCL